MTYGKAQEMRKTTDEKDVASLLMAFAEGHPIRCQYGDGTLIIDPFQEEIGASASAVIAEEFDEKRLAKSALLDLMDRELSFGVTFLMDPRQIRSHAGGDDATPDRVAETIGDELSRAILHLVPLSVEMDGSDILAVTFLANELTSAMALLPGVTASDAVAFYDSKREAQLREFRAAITLPSGDRSRSIEDYPLLSYRREDTDLLVTQLAKIFGNKLLFHALGHSRPVDLVGQMEAGRTIFLRIPRHFPGGMAMCLTALLCLMDEGGCDVACEAMESAKADDGADRSGIVDRLRRNAVEWGLAVSHDEVERILATRADLIRKGDWDGLRKLAGDDAVE